jgi:hypothetical protein
MNTKELADKLKLSVRQTQRAAKAGNIHPAPTWDGPKLVFHPDSIYTPGRRGRKANGVKHGR